MSRGLPRGKIISHCGGRGGLFRSCSFPFRYRSNFQKLCLLLFKGTEFWYKSLFQTYFLLGTVGFYQLVFFQVHKFFSTVFSFRYRSIFINLFGTTVLFKTFPLLGSFLQKRFLLGTWQSFSTPFFNLLTLFQVQKYFFQKCYLSGTEVFFKLIFFWVQQVFFQIIFFQVQK